MTPTQPMGTQDTAAPIKHEPVEPIMYVLLGAIMFFVLLLVWISKFSPNDGQTFQVVSGLLTGFSGAFLTRLKLPESRKATSSSATAGPGGPTVAIQEKP